MIGKHGMTKLLGFSAFVAVWTLTVGGCLEGDEGIQGLDGVDGLQGLIGPQGTAGPQGPPGSLDLMPGNADGQILRWDDSAGQWVLDTESPRLITYVTGYNVFHQTIGTTETVTGRTVAFTKQYAASRLRITYSDNLMVSNAPGANAGIWEVYLDGAPIANPAPLKTAITTWSFSSTEHRQSTLVGYAEGVSAGAHTILVQVSTTSPAIDCRTGKDSTFLLEVEEIP